MNASTAILLIIILVAAFFAARHMIRSFSGDGSCHGGGSGKKAKAVEVEDTDESHYPYSEDLQIGGMSCENCVVAVEGAINSIDGMWGRVDLETKTAHILSKNPIDDEAVNTAVREAGYYLVQAY